jgi:DNA modification methylase
MKTNPADKVQQWAIERLTPYARNARTHSAAQVAQLAASIREWGWTTPILVSPDGGVIAGHGRLLAAQQLGMATVPVIIAEGWSAAKTRAYVLADNQLALQAGWDNELLALELGELGELGFDLDLTGFGEGEIAALTPGGTEGLTDPDEVPEPPVDPTTKPGDLWLLGEHRVLCGDSTKGEDMARLMGGAATDLIWTDPPYGVNHIGGTKDPRRETHRSGGVVHNDDRVGDELIAMVSEAIRNVPRHDSTVLYVASPAGSNLREIIDAFNASGFEFRHSLVWVKSSFVFGRCDYHYRHEMLLYGWGKKHEWAGPRDISTVFEFPRGDKTIEHPTSKPVGLVVATAKNHPGHVMADPFLGSGTTLIAAEQLGRKCYGMEISPAYCDVIVKRWEQFTGKKATLAPHDIVCHTPKSC